MATSIRATRAKSVKLPPRTARRSRAIAAVAFLCVAALAFLFRDRILWQMGQSLVNAGPPQKADMIVVLGGDWLGKRVLKAGSLVREGYAPKVLLSGVQGFFGSHESDLAIGYAMENGFPRDYFIPFRYPALATIDEAEHDAGRLRQMGVHKFLLVTDPWHTARAVRIFRRVAPDLEVHAVACEDRKWANGYWWTTREGRKVWVMEELKTAANLLGI